MFGGNEIVVVIVVAILLLFSGKKVPELMHSLGRAIGDFKKGRIEAEKEVEEAFSAGKKEALKKDKKVKRKKKKKQPISF